MISFGPGLVFLRMIYDRDYMREPERRMPSATTGLLILLGICFLIQAGFYFDRSGSFLLIKEFGLSLTGIRQHRWWQLITFQLLHSFPSPWHVLGNGLVIYFFGRTVESVLGSARFLVAFFVGGVVGGLVQLLCFWAVPESGSIPVVGASAGASTLIAIFCRLFPEREATFVIYFFPVRLRAQYVLWAALAISTWGALFAWSGVAEGAHLGGLLFGIAWVSAIQEDGVLSMAFSRLQDIGRRRSTPARAPESNRRRVLEFDAVKPSPKPVAPTGEFISQEVDPILDKIAAHGIHSLTDREKRVLEAARDRMGKR